MSFIFLYINATYLIGVGFVFGEYYEDWVSLGCVNKFPYVKFPKTKGYYIRYIPVHKCDVLTVIGSNLVCWFLMLIDVACTVLYYPLKFLR